MKGRPRPDWSPKVAVGVRSPRVRHPLAEWAERQHGVVSIRQLLGPLGFSQSAVARATASGRLHRVYRGVFAVGHTRLSLRGQCLAAVLACGPDALLSHASAAWLWEVSNRSPAPLEVTGPVRRRPRLPICNHHSQILEPDDCALIDGIPVTALPRTLLDLAATVPRHRLERALDTAEHIGIFDLGAIESLLARAGGHHGVGTLRKALDIYRPLDALRSKFERRFLTAVRDAGLPSPSANFNLAGYELDMYWPQERFVIELDVYETHGTHAAFENDRLRQEDLKLAGIEMIRVTGPRFDREPQEVIERIIRHLGQRRRELTK